MAEKMSEAVETARSRGESPFVAVGLAYVSFALEEPAAFQVMWRSEMIYGEDPAYRKASKQLTGLVQSGFANSLDDEDAHDLSSRELLAWSVVHGLAALYTDGPLLNGPDIDAKLARARETLKLMNETFERGNGERAG
jgi:hypothetical protein